MNKTILEILAEIVDAAREATKERPPAGAMERLRNLIAGYDRIKAAR